MKQFVEKLIALERDIVAEKGDFVLFALFEREESPGKWDVVISAPWFGKDKKTVLQFVVHKIQATLTIEEVMMLSRVILLDPTDDFVHTVTSEICIEHGNMEFADRAFNGIAVKHAHIITSKSAEC
jgi:hypothetical protein